ncbi:MAG: amidohydrolase family protein [Prevotella sp.]|nr:amidohydrolase family protein [Prevotella sp.]
MKLLVAGGTIVSEGRQFEGCLAVDNGRITEITEGRAPQGKFDVTICTAGSYVLPGVIDSHVHFREPGLTQKGDIESESRAAVYGGVTSFFDMPNTLPQTVSNEALNQKFALAENKSYANYSFFPAATATNLTFLQTVETQRIPGIKLFMGASTGGMLVDSPADLERIFRLAAERGLTLVAHCEDSAVIERNMQRYKAECGADPDISLHPEIRSAEACLASSSLAAQLAAKFGTHLHIAHISTAGELALLGGCISGEICTSYLLFDERDYRLKRSMIKCNPAIKTAADKAALRKAAKDRLVATIATDHAPHLLGEKQGGAARAASGMPMVQFSLPAVLTVADEERMPLTTVAELMSHSPARLFGVKERGFLRPGFKADIAVVRREKWRVDRSCVQSKCGWSPIEGMDLSWRVTHTICNGNLIYNDGAFDNRFRGEEIMFERH